MLVPAWYNLHLMNYGPALRLFGHRELLRSNMWQHWFLYFLMTSLANELFVFIYSVVVRAPPLPKVPSVSVEFAFACLVSPVKKQKTTIVGLIKSKKKKKEIIFRKTENALLLNFQPNRTKPPWDHFRHSAVRFIKTYRKLYPSHRSYCRTGKLNYRRKRSQELNWLSFNMEKMYAKIMFKNLTLDPN